MAKLGLAEETYGRLRRVADIYLSRERADHTLQPTALVHEAWLRLARYRAEHTLSEEEVVVLGSHVMRHVLTDHARTWNRRVPAQSREATAGEVEDSGAAIVAEVGELLRELSETDPELALVTELRFFGGHTLEEVGRVLGLSRRTVHRRWQLARAWLLTAMSTDTESSS